MEFDVLILGSVAPRPHVLHIKGYPPNLSVLDFLELAEAGKTFASIELMAGLKWSQMILRKRHELKPLPRNAPLVVEKGESLVIGMTTSSVLSELV